MIIFFKFHFFEYPLNTLYQKNRNLKEIDFALLKALNDLNTLKARLGHVAVWLREGLQIPYSNRLIPYKHCIIQQFRLQVFSVGHSWDIEINNYDSEL